MLPDTEGSMYSTTDALREHIRELLALGDGTEYYDRESGIYVKKLTDKADDGWGQYSGTYYISEGQHLTRYFFVSEKVSGSSPSSGNFLDDVWFNQELPPAKDDADCHNKAGEDECIKRQAHRRRAFHASQFASVRGRRLL